MYDDYGHLLYVGKAKNLRTRLMSYRRIKITTTSRKSLRLVHQVSEIQWEESRSEKAALLLENRLLRKLKPPFNVVNTTPETYFYFTVKILEEELPDSAPIAPNTMPIVITLSMTPNDPEAAVFGAFKGLASSQRAFFALRRMLWLVHERNESDPFYYPLHFIRRQKLHPHHCALTKFWLNQLAGFFHGMSLPPTQSEPDFVLSLRELANQIKNCDPFHTNWIQEDIESLLKFFRTGPKRNASLKKFSKKNSATIAQKPTAVSTLWLIKLMCQMKSPK